MNVGPDDGAREEQHVSMARTLSDQIIISMIEAATRLAGGRGPITGSGAASVQGGAAGQPAAVPGAGATPDPTSTGAVTAPAGAAGGTQGADAGSSAGSPGGGHDMRTADQIASDFKTIYGVIEEVVKNSAEQETKSVGFSVR